MVDPKSMIEKKQVKRDISATAPKKVGSFAITVAIGIILLCVAATVYKVSMVWILLGVLALIIYVNLSTIDVLVQLEEYRRAIVFRFGRFQKVAGPGWIIVLPFIDEYVIVDLRVQTVDIKPQDVVTKDNVKLTLDAIVYMKVEDPKAAILNVDNYTDAAITYVAAHLRDVVGKMELGSVISEVNIINELLQKGLEKIAREWGVKVIKVEIQSLQLPPDLMQAMHERKSAEQKKLAAKEEAMAQALKIDAVREAAGKLTDPAMQYLYLQALEKVATGRASKIIFPLELTNLAAKLAGTTKGMSYEKVAEDLRQKYSETVLQESQDEMDIELKKKVDKIEKKE